MVLSLFKLFYERMVEVVRVVISLICFSNLICSSNVCVSCFNSLFIAISSQISQVINFLSKKATLTIS